MGFLDKALNKMLDLEEKEVSTTELADMIEEKILKAEYSSKGLYNTNLELVREAAKKDWILITGNGGTSRNYDIIESGFKITAKYSMLTHKMQTVELFDKENKITYVIPKGRENAKDVCAKILARVERYQNK